MDSEEDTLFPGGDYINNEKDEDVITDTRSNEEASLAKNDHLGYKSESSSFHISEELPSSRIVINSWLDFPNSCIDLKDEYTDGNNDTSLTKLMNLTDTTNLNSVRGDSLQLKHEPGLFGHEDKVNDDFLDCDWATFGDFDDIEKLFRKNDSIFGHDMIGDVDGFLSPSTDVIDSTAKSIPIPDLPLCKDQTSDEGCSSIQLDDHPDKQRSPVQKEKVNGQKIIPTSQNKAEEMKKNIPSRNFTDYYNQNQHMATTNVHASVATPLQTFQPKAISHQMQFGDAKLMEHHGSSNQVVFTPHGYPTYCFPAMQFPPNVQIDRNQKRPVPASYEVRPDDTKHQKISNRVLDAKPATMSPHAKMEKLRRLQQMQAQLAIEKQHQQYSTTGVDVSVPQLSSQNNQTLDAMTSTITIDECAHKVPSSELNMVAELDESQRTSRLTYDSPAEETTYYQLQDVVGKLDMRTRLCIRDGLFRLARSAVYRQSASDRSSTNKSNKDKDEVSVVVSRNSDRLTGLADTESDTNPIDRIVANFLFQRPTEACPRLGSYELLGST